MRVLAETSEKSARDVQNLASQIEIQVASVASIVQSAAETASTEAEKSRTVILALGELRKEVGALAKAVSPLRQRRWKLKQPPARRKRVLRSYLPRWKSRQLPPPRRFAASSSKPPSWMKARPHRDLCPCSPADLESVSNQRYRRRPTCLRRRAALNSRSGDVGSAAQIMSAVDQISRGAQQQAAATQEASAAMNQVEKTAQSFRESAATSLERTTRMDAMLGECRLQIGDLSQGVHGR